MQATITQEQELNLQQEYLPMQLFLKLLEQDEPFPYKTSFSFSQYIDTISGKLTAACQHTQSALKPLIKHNEELINKGEVDLDKMAASPEFQTILSMAVPSMMFKDEMSFIAPPFQKKYLARTRAMDKLFDDPDWEVNIPSTDIESKKFHVIRQAGLEILKTFYDQDISQNYAQIFKIRNKKTKIEKHFQIRIRTDFIKINALKELKPLSQDEINKLIRTNDAELWLEHLPVDAFEFKGFTVGNLHDVTELEVISELKHWLNDSINNKQLEPQEFMAKLGQYIMSYIQEDGLRMGMVMVTHDKYFKDYDLSLSGINGLDKLVGHKRKGEIKGIYDHVFEKKKIVYIEDLRKLEIVSDPERKLIKNKVRSIILLPILNEENELISLVEFGSKNSDTFNAFSLDKLKNIFEILNGSYRKFIVDINNNLSNVIQQNFTSVHPSVRWKFEEVAMDYFMQIQDGVRETQLQPIVFKNVYPLFGQADIIGSSSIRGKAVCIDLTKNLELLSSLMNDWLNVKELHLLESYKLKVDKTLVSIKDRFISSDESTIVNMISEEIHPLLERLNKRHYELPSDVYEAYLQRIDPKLNILFEKRKEFEYSVMKVNSAISAHLAEEQEKMQKVLPHFYEKYKTDGVEYNIYLGQSLLENGKYHKTDLLNFKLWQLNSMVEITRLVENLKTKLAVPLDTAQMIFAYNNSLGIRFRMDEKKFDVDGAYNVRYEILKKRIDKATIVGTDERLRKEKTIAIVYLNQDDKVEYLEFLQSLIDKKMISEDIEDLALNKVQGAEGLRALRVTVLIEGE